MMTFDTSAPAGAENGRHTQTPVGMAGDAAAILAGMGAAAYFALAEKVRVSVDPVRLLHVFCTAILLLVRT